MAKKKYDRNARLLAAHMQPLLLDVVQARIDLECATLDVEEASTSSKSVTAMKVMAETQRAYTVAMLRMEGLLAITVAKGLRE